MKSNQHEFQARTEVVEGLIKKLETAGDPELRATALELVQTVMELHCAALERMLHIVSGSSEGEQAFSNALQDSLVASMFLLHGLHPRDVEARVLDALVKVRPYLHSHGGDVEMISIKNGILRLRLQGSCGSCPSSSLTLKSAVEDAVFEAAPDILEIVAENAAPDEQLNASQLVVLK